ncbi:biotin--[acetyl-CoA-carboxylase] ligase [Phorcysia thermohydrogeniphila]|uniref:biotin--[biotin carboxyl-carrier protein] ligase n=1 Tax=Phorcysia thermohydrogeniphila TaxID=936138 RepID=A0A4V2PDT1_9BACT|nr:biotin--[acetyl-CoA-carboxylase] ligase [Phorcysia thermohydrogeniphila]TCK06426.1 BirA family biotin operon repressor/biotin-[acetyl-CoA-carboxylase] ligase [Phorcysia thermohydrogeniphila]
MELVFLEEVDSTNEYLKRIPFRSNLFVVARRQTGGKGRRGKSWLSLPDKGLYLSGLFEPLHPKKSSLAGLAFGVAVLRALQEFKDDFYLKWPNDVYVNGKKVAGILPENLSDRLIVGVGVNVSYTLQELQGLSHPATSLLVEGIRCDIGELALKVSQNLILYYEKLREGTFDVKEFESFCPMIGKEVTVLENGFCYTGKALGIDREGYLLLEKDGELKRLFSAEVSVRFNDEGNRVSNLQGAP